MQWNEGEQHGLGVPRRTRGAAIRRHHGTVISFWRLRSWSAAGEKEELFDPLDTRHNEI
jgi:hypothetical protein